MRLKRQSHWWKAIVSRIQQMAQGGKGNPSSGNSAESETHTAFPSPPVQEELQWTMFTIIFEGTKSVTSCQFMEAWSLVL